MAFICKPKCHLVEFAVTDFQPEFKNDKLWYVSMGSGQTIIDPFMGLIREIFWSDGPPSVQDGIFAATWMLDHAVKVNPGGVNAPIRIATLERANGDWTARMIADDELLEHQQNVDAAKEALRHYKEHMAASAGAVELPAVPAPPPSS